MSKRIAVTVVFAAMVGVLILSLAGCGVAQGQGTTSGGRGQRQGQGQGQSSGSAGLGQGNQAAQSGAQANGSYAQGQGKGGRGQGGGGGSNSGNNGGSAAAGGLTNLPPATAGELSADETAALLFMREEEKLAHDVYVTLYNKWSLPAFQNISASEQTHTDAVKALIDRYNLADPASNNVGVFTNPDLQKLYTELIARGSQSAAEALKVGAAIEEIDILDLEKRFAQTDNADIQQVFNNLKSGSYNHLQAFATNLQTQSGETYQPQYLSADAYKAIINGSSSNGGGRGQGGGNGGRGAGGGGQP